MRYWLAGLVMLLSQSAFAQTAAPPSAPPAAVPTIPFDSVSDPLKLPRDMYLGEVSGVAVNSKGHIFVLQRGNTTGPAYAAAAAQLLEFGADGVEVRPDFDKAKLDLFEARAQVAPAATSGP